MMSLTPVQQAATQDLVALVKKYDLLNNRGTQEGKELLARIRTYGLAASFFGGYEAMSQLCKAAEELDRPVGYWINYAWEDIAGWMP